MRMIFFVLAMAGVALAIWLWGFDGADWVRIAAADGQRAAQNAMAGALRAIRRGEPGALLALWGLCFAYGVAHAAGPGHGKLLIGGAGLGSRIGMGKLTGLSVASSLAQALTAIIFVYGGVAVLGLARQQVQGLADRWMASVSYGMIALVGLWLLWRGIRHLLASFSAQQTGQSCGHAPHAHPHAAACPDCGHAHGPTPEQAANVRGLRDALALIAAIAIRPCTGALFLLIITWQMQIAFAGIIGALVMGLGTGLVTSIVAVLSIAFRDTALASSGSGQTARRLSAVLEIGAGAIVALLAGQLALRGL